MTDPVIKVSGDAENGFIVEIHDGDRFECYGLHADDADKASAEGMRRFHPPVAVVASGPENP